MDIIKENFDVTIKFNAEIEKFQIKENLFVYKIECYRNTFLIYLEGINTQKTIDKLINELKSGNSKPDIENSEYYVINSSFIKKMKYHGFWGGDANDLTKNIQNSPFSTLCKNKGTIVRLDYSAHMAYDLNDVPIPCALRFNYIAGSMNNKYYDIKKALMILSKRDDVRGLKRYSIPYYNRETDKDEGFEFYWMPKLEDYIKVLDKSYKKYVGVDFYRTVSDLDIFGLRSGGATLSL